MVVRPFTKDHLKDLLDCPCIQHRANLTSTFGQNVLAVYCPGADKVLNLQSGKHSVLVVPPLIDETWVTLFVKCAVELTIAPTDVFAIVGCKASSNKDMFTTSTKCCMDKNDLTPNYVHGEETSKHVVQ